MSCSRWHRLIALDAGGDLDANEGPALERHLKSCSACRLLAEELRTSQDTLRRLDSEATAASGLGSVRGAVLAEVASRRRPPLSLAPGRPRLALVGVATMLVAAVVLLRQGGTPPQPRPSPTELPNPIEIAETVPARSPSVVPHVETAPESVAAPPAHLAEDSPPRQARVDLAPVDHMHTTQPSAPTEPMTVKILTDDPEVIIYWIVDPKGDKDHA